MAHNYNLVNIRNYYYINIITTLLRSENNQVIKLVSRKLRVSTMLFYNQWLDNQSPSLEYEVPISLTDFNCFCLSLTWHNDCHMASFQ